jgi:hypothetical protein
MNHFQFQSKLYHTKNYFTYEGSINFHMHSINIGLAEEHFTHMY